MAKKHVVNGTGNGNGHITTEKIVSLELLVELTPAEHTVESENLAKLDLEINADREAARADAASRRESTKLKVERRDALASVVETHKEKRLVECQLEANFERGVIITKNRKTGEFVAERAMEAEERDAMAQGRLPWDLVPLPAVPVNDVEAHA